MNPTLARLRQPISFLLVGASSAGLYFLLLWGLQDLITSTILLTACCYAASMVYNFFLQGWMTFRAGAPTPRSLTRFVSMHAIAMALNSLAMAALVDLLRVPLLPGQVFVTACISVLVFLVSKHWVYRTSALPD